MHVDVDALTCVVRTASTFALYSSIISKAFSGFTSPLYGRYVDASYRMRHSASLCKAADRRRRHATTRVKNSARCV